MIHFVISLFLQFMNIKAFIFRIRRISYGNRQRIRIFAMPSADIVVNFPTNSLRIISMDEYCKFISACSVDLSLITDNIQKTIRPSFNQFITACMAAAVASVAPAE